VLSPPTRLRGKGALDNHGKSAEIREAIAGDSPFLRSRLAGTYSFVAGILQPQGDYDRAIVLQRKSLDIIRKVSDADPTNATYREFLNEAYCWVGYHSEKKGDLAQASLNYRQALAGFEALTSADPKEARTRLYVGMCEKSIGTVLVAGGHTTEGLESIRKGLAILEELSRADQSENIEKFENVADAYAAIGLAYSTKAARPNISGALRMTLWREARTAYQKSLDTWLEMKRRGALTAFSAREPERIAGEIAKCDAALAELRAGIH